MHAAQVAVALGSGIAAGFLPTVVSGGLGADLTTENEYGTGPLGAPMVSAGRRSGSGIGYLTTEDGSYVCALAEVDAEAAAGGVNDRSELPVGVTP